MTVASSGWVSGCGPDGRRKLIVAIIRTREVASIANL
jgi:hypothetical protein